MYKNIIIAVLVVALGYSTTVLVYEQAPIDKTPKKYLKLMEEAL